MGRYDESAIIDEASQILGGDEQVLAAGYFGLHDLLGAQIAGGTAGALTGSITTDAIGASALGAGLGGAAAVKAYAESQGVTVQLIVAVTEAHIHVLNRDTGGRLPDRVACLDRADCDVEVKKFGLSRIISLTDRSSGATLQLHGAASPLSAQSKGDKAVLELIAA